MTDKPATSRPIAVSAGDPSGIGPEIICKAIAQLQGQCLIYGDANILQDQIQQLGLAIPITLLRDASAWNPAINGMQLIECSAVVDRRLGRISAENGAAAAHAITRAVHDVQAGLASALVTAPIHKEALSAAGLPWPGHTELLAHLAGGVDVRMMLANPELRTVLVTIHQSLRKAIQNITIQSVLQTIQITNASLKQMGIAHPRIAVAGLNPHAGEAGLFGDEEIEHIAPAIKQAQAQGIAATGPYPGDTIFSKARGFKLFDVVVAMYHDQGLIPVKYLGIEDGVNITLGLPFVRTSVDHGTAFDIAGQGIADHRSLINAFRMAQALSKPIPQQL